MSDPGTLVAILAAAVVALAMVSLAALKGWDGWLELRRLELTQGKDARAEDAPPPPGSSSPISRTASAASKRSPMATRTRRPSAARAELSARGDGLWACHVLSLARRRLCRLRAARRGRPLPAADRSRPRARADARRAQDRRDPGARLLGGGLGLSGGAGATARLHFLADSNAAITKGIVALILLAVQDRAPGGDPRRSTSTPSSPASTSRNQLSSNRTQGIPNMIALIRETAERLAA